jgi:hypothetical protein
MDNPTFSASQALNSALQLLSQQTRAIIAGVLINLTVMAVATSIVTYLNWHTINQLVTIVHNTAACNFNITCLLTSVLPHVISSVVNLGGDLNTLIISILILILLASYLWFGLTQYLGCLNSTNSASLIYLFPNPLHALEYFIGTIIYLLMAIAVIPGIYWAYRFSFFNTILATRSSGIIGSFATSWSLTKEQGWGLVALTSILTLLTCVTQTITLICIITMPCIITLLSLMPYYGTIILLNCLGTLFISFLCTMPCILIAQTCTYQAVQGNSITHS